jgi:NADH-quinone oxidoreductase subunit J
MVAAGLGVVLLRNPIHSALSLIVAMTGVSVLFAMLDAHFLAVVQLIVYAGAIMVLVVFVLMLLQAKDETPRPRALTGTVLALLAGGGLLYGLIPVLQNGLVTLNQRSLTASYQGVEGSVKAMGAVLFSDYVFPFEIASLLIMAALVGAVMVGSRSIHKREA